MTNAPIQKGQIVKIKLEWQDAGDANLTFIARNNEEMGRLDISTIEDIDRPLWGMQTVNADMLIPTDIIIELGA